MQEGEKPEVRSNEKWGAQGERSNREEACDHLGVLAHRISMQPLQLLQQNSCCRAEDLLWVKNAFTRCMPTSFARVAFPMTLDGAKS